MPVSTPAPDRAEPAPEHAEPKPTVEPPAPPVTAPPVALDVGAESSEPVEVTPDPVPLLEEGTQAIAQSEARWDKTIFLCFWNIWNFVNVC